jgi:hypothetical protein
MKLYRVCHGYRGANRRTHIAAFLCIAFLVACTLNTHALAEPSQTFTEIRDSTLELDVTAVEGGDLRDEIEVRISSLDSSTTAKAFVLSNPKRLVLDVTGLTVSRPYTRLLPDASVARTLRVAAHPGKVRLVLDLDEQGEITHQLQEKLGGIYLRVGLKHDGPGPSAKLQSIPPVSSIEVAEPPLGSTEVGSEVLSPSLKQPDPVEVRVVRSEPPTAAAGIESPLAVSVPALFFRGTNREVADLTVTNRSGDRVSVETALAPTASMTKAVAPDIIVSPRRFELEPGASRIVRVFSREQKAAAAYSRLVELKPSLLPAHDVELSHELSHDGPVDGLAAATLAPVEIKVFFSNSTEGSSLLWFREKDRLVLANASQSTIVLEDIAICAASGDLPCSHMANFSLMAAETHELSVREENLVRIQLLEGNIRQNIVIDGFTGVRR